MSGSEAQSRERFPSTHWSLVGRAGDADSPVKREALATLLLRYMPAMKVYLMRKRRLADDAADDLLQGFVGEKVLDGPFVAAADRRRGRFRSFLLTSLDHFLIDQVRRNRADGSTGSDHGADTEDPAAPGAPDPFDVAWARQVINEALCRTEEECRAAGRADVWGMFEQRVVGPTLQDRPAPPYEQLVATFGFTSPTQASNCLVTAKRMFARALRAVVTEYAGEDGNVEEELGDLMKILSSGRARSG
jgi:DNA-directed RNA polymerase specialized sigma24 family protein